MTDEPNDRAGETPCVNCGERPNEHSVAGRALICKRQTYYAPTLDHRNAIASRRRADTAEEERAVLRALTKGFRLYEENGGDLDGWSDADLKRLKRVREVLARREKEGKDK